jgi:uncharacterized membrane protein
LLERLFELAFKYRSVVFEQAAVGIRPPMPIAVVAGLVAAAAGAAIWAHLRAGRAVPAWARSTLLALRLTAIAAVAFSLVRPVLIVRTVEPQRNFLAVLIDDSRSMSIADRGSDTRGSVVSRIIGPGSRVSTALAARFGLRVFSFAASTDRLADIKGLRFAGTRSNLGQALDRTAEAMAGLPTSGIVLLTDGADTSRLPLADSVRKLTGAGLPVFAVGVGREAFERDIQIGRIDPPASVLKGTTLFAEVVVSQTGFAGQKVPLIVEDETQTLASQDLTLPRDGEPATVRVSLPLVEAGPRVLRFRIPVQPGEQVLENNQREALVSVEDTRERLLYIEGEPRFEMKFLRQAVAEDKNLQVVTLQRTAERKFLRLDIDAPDDLAGGFPKTREELYAYRGLVLGSIEASAFTQDQLRMMADFVNIRGGGLLALGGGRAFAEGGFAGTPVAEMLPVVIDGPKAADTFLARVQVRPTRLGQTHAVTQVAPTEQASLERWKTLPMLTTVNPVTRVKPGAAVLLEGGAQSRDNQVVLAYNRYGAGKVIAMPVQDVWTWQMDPAMPVEDQTHETLWRRLLRWTIDAVPRRVTVAVDKERAEPGDRVAATAAVRDARYIGVNDATLRAVLLGPGGSEQALPMTASAERDGEYAAAFTADRAGLYEVRVDASRGKDPPIRARAFVRAAPDDAEYFDAAMRGPLLRRVAEDTGGRFYTADSVSALPDDITYLGRGVTSLQEKDLWDLPAVLVLFVACVCGEWLIRRRVGLA